MRKTILMLIACTLLAGCESSTPTPLSRAIAALRVGDRQAFVAARADAETELKTAIQPGGNLCKVTVADLIKHHAVYAIRRMDHDDLFRLPEEDRLALVLHLTGRGAHVPPDSFLRGAPDFVLTRENADLCKDEDSNYMARQLEHASYSMNENNARIEVLRPWIEEVQARHGEQYDSQMRSAVNHLAANGYGAKWPAELKLD